MNKTYAFFDRNGASNKNKSPKLIEILKQSRCGDIFLKPKQRILTVLSDTTEWPLLVIEAAHKHWLLKTNGNWLNAVR